MIHGVLVGAGTYWFASTLHDRSARDAETPQTVEVDVVELPERRLVLPRVARRSGTPDPTAPPPEPHQLLGGGVVIARPDMPSPGRGGTDTARESALNLADSIDGLTLDRDPINRLDRSQVQRLDTAQRRRSRDDRRATPNPMQLTFVASGDGLLRERRRPSRFDPDTGRRLGGVPSRLGGELGGPGAAAPGWASRPGATRVGGAEQEAAGVAAGARGGGFRRSAAVVLARPAVAKARAAVPAPARGRPSDDVDSSQEVATAVQSLIHASAAGGKLGPGPGGSQGPGRPASGGDDGSGATSAPAGRGGLGDVAYDPRFSGYHSGILARVDRYWSDAFPSWAIAEGRGGMAIVQLTLLKDGNVAGVRVIRGSGITEFDRNLVAAVRRAAPFDPLPAALAPSHRMNIQFDATNPAVGREGP